MEKIFPVAQAPNYPDQTLVREVEQRLESYPSLVSEFEIMQLKEQLSAVSRGDAFLLQGGDCAESFANFRPETIRENFKVFLQMAIVLTYGAKRPVVKVGRVAGQFAKPRSSAFEARGEQELPSYRGDIVNGFEFTEESRRHDPLRMERAYFQSAATLNTIRSLAKGGFADLHQVQSWNLAFVQDEQLDPRYKQIVERLQDSLAFMRATGLSSAATLEGTDFFTSHEALLLNYERALTRESEQDKSLYAGSAHMLWIGERTRQLDGAHVKYASSISNPIGIKCGPEMTADDLLRLTERLNPKNETGRLTVISRMGAEKIEQRYPQLVRRVKAEGRALVWCCDPMHGNTESVGGMKTRSFDAILAETKSFFAIHAAEKTVAGGVHLELTGKDVMECTGGGQKIAAAHLHSGKYETLCDPRLNATQALELAFQLISP